jgi:RNA polymerase sigma-70 factor, ECF subfamily
VRRSPAPRPDARPSPSGQGSEDGGEHQVPDRRTTDLLAERSRLVGLAYRITGSRLDAEDVVQEAWVRAQGVDWSTVERPVAWLTRVVARLSLDALKRAHRRRETYVGPWLPEPVATTVPVPGTVAAGVAAGAGDPAELVTLAESLTFGFLRVLDALSPVERVVFLLADVFGTPYDEIAATVARNPAACRQLASRARRKVRANPVPHDPPETVTKVAEALMGALVRDDLDAVMSLLADDVELLSDGGPTARAARRPVVGPSRVTRLIVNLLRRYPIEGFPVMLNGEPGMVGRVDGRLFLAVSAQVVDGRVVAFHVMRNPDKLAALTVTTSMD